MTPRTRTPDRSPLPRALAASIETRLAEELERLRRRLSAADLRARGDRDAALVEGLIVVPGTGTPAPHAWVESGDRVHDHTQGEFRTVWPRELYYRVFRATPRAA